MLGRAFLVVSVAFLALLAFAFYQDLSRPWAPIQEKYAAQYGQDFPIQVQQLFPKVQVNGQFLVERCITCHVPDIAKIGPQEAAKRLGPNHPAMISDAIFAKYGQDTLICRPVAARMPWLADTGKPRFFSLRIILTSPSDPRYSTVPSVEALSTKINS